MRKKNKIEKLTEEDLLIAGEKPVKVIGGTDPPPDEKKAYKKKLKKIVGIELGCAFAAITCFFAYKAVTYKRPVKKEVHEIASVSEKKYTLKTPKKKQVDSSGTSAEVYTDLDRALLKVIEESGAAEKTEAADSSEDADTEHDKYTHIEDQANEQ